MLIHDFIIVSEVPEEIIYSNYSKEDMTQISDDFILKYHNPLGKVEMYSENLKQKKVGLNYYGTTILDTKMAEKLKTELVAVCEQSDDLVKLITLIDLAITERKYIIHFGI